MKFFRDGISIDEFKVSSLVICFIGTVIYAVYAYHTTGDISASWLDLMKTLIYVIGGVNAVNGIATILNPQKNQLVEPEFTPINDDENRNIRQGV